MPPFHCRINIAPRLQERELKATPPCKSSFKLLWGFHLINMATYSRVTEVFFCLIVVGFFLLLLTLKQITSLRSESRGSWVLWSHQFSSPLHFFSKWFQYLTFKTKPHFTLKYHYFPLNEGLYSMKHKRQILFSS